MSESTSNLKYLTGTGWPDPTVDEDYLHRAFALLDAYDREAVTQEVREALGLEKGQQLSDALPLSWEVRERLWTFFGRGAEAADPEQWINVLRRVIRGENERRRAEQADGRRTCLYRFHDEAGRLLYVGIASDPDARERQHRYSQRWAPLIGGRTDEWFDTRKEAAVAELAAIKDEAPLFNEAGRRRLPALPPEEVA